MRKLRRRVHDVLEAHTPKDPVTRIVGFALITLILLNLLAIVLDSVEGIDNRYGVVLRAFEFLSLIVFSVEYVLRLWACAEDAAYQRPILGRVRYFFTPMALIDLLAIAPFYLPMFLPFDLRFLRALRLFRLARVLKLGRYSEALRTLGRVLRSKKEELAVTASAVLAALVVSSSLMYFIEHEAQPKAFPSIPAAMWWGVVTLTTVGYGDVYPITPLGKITGALIALSGIGLFALPAGILAGGFAREIQQENRKATRCPHCGKEI
jgi:voltage-gated potassium channel